MESQEEPTTAITEFEDCKGCLEPLEHSILERIPEMGQQILRCITCHKCRGVFVEERKFLSLEETLRSQRESNGWKEVHNSEDRRALFILSQILHNEQEFDASDSIEFSLPPSTDHVKILWDLGQAIGFYSVKLRGTYDPDVMTSYTMSTVDTIFIRKSHRRRGFGLTALKSLRMDFPSQKIAFSYPLTPSMRQVLWKHLKETREDRLRFWEATDSWGGSRNVWLTLQRENKTSLSIIPA